MNRYPLTAPIFLKFSTPLEYQPPGCLSISSNHCFCLIHQPLPPHWPPYKVVCPRVTFGPLYFSCYPLSMGQCHQLQADEASHSPLAHQLKTSLLSFWPICPNAHVHLYLKSHRHFKPTHWMPNSSFSLHVGSLLQYSLILLVIITKACQSVLIFLICVFFTVPSLPLHEASHLLPGLLQSTNRSKSYVK